MIDMEFKGTKGEWIVGKAIMSDTKNEELVIYPENKLKIDGKHRIIASISPMNISDSGDLANAKLISKAPDMLNMLSSVMDLLEAYPSESEMHVKATEIRTLIKEATTI